MCKHNLYTYEFRHFIFTSQNSVLSLRYCTRFFKIHYNKWFYFSFFKQSTNWNDINVLSYVFNDQIKFFKVLSLGKNETFPVARNQSNQWPWVFHRRSCHLVLSVIGVVYTAVTIGDASYLNFYAKCIFFFSRKLCVEKMLTTK